MGDLNETIMEAEPLLSLPMGPVRTLGDNRVGWIPNCEDAAPPRCAPVCKATCCAFCAFCAVRYSNSARASGGTCSACYAFCACYLVCTCCTRCARSTRFQNLTCNTVGHKSAPPARNVQIVAKGICRSHFLSRSEQRGALILDTLNRESRPPVELSPHPRIPPPRPLPPPDADQPTLTQIDQHPSDRQHVRSLPLRVEADRTGGHSKYSLLPPVTVPNRGTLPALSHSSVTSSGRRSVSAPLPLSHNALPPRSSLLHPPPHASLLPTAAYADNRHTHRYSLLPHAHVYIGLSPDVAPSAPPQPSTIPVKKDGRYRSQWSLLPDMPPAKYRKTL